MKNYILILFTLFYSAIFSQQLQVKDKDSQLGIAGVLLLSGDKSVTTNEKGEADVSGFIESDTIDFIHPSYQKSRHTAAYLKTYKYRIDLVTKYVILNEIVFSANKKEEKMDDLPYQVEVIKQAQIEFNNSQTAADMLINSGNVFVQKSQGGGGSPVLRGFEANKVLIVVDGIRMNNAIYRGGHLQDIITLDAQMLDRTEVLFGPASTTYGSDALGGVMNLYTKNAQFGDDNMLLKANAMLRYSTANQENTGHIDFNIGLKKIAFLTNITYSTFGDLRAGNNPLAGFDTSWKRKYYVERIGLVDSMMKNSDPNVQRGSGYSQLDFMERINFKQSEKLTHGLNFQISQSSDINRYDRLTELKSPTRLRYAEWKYGPQKRMLAAYNLNFTGKTAISDNVKFTLAYQKIAQERVSRRIDNTTRKTQLEDVAVYSANIDAHKFYREKYEIRYGAEFTYNDVKSTANFTDIITGIKTLADTRYPDGGSNMMTAAVYFTHSTEINKNLIFIDGLRFSYVTLNSKFVDTTFFKFPFTTASQKNKALTGNLGLIFKSENGSKATIIGSTGFRSPNVDDVTKVFDSNSSAVLVPNANLKPEYAYNIEMSLTRMVENKHSFSLTGYYTMLENAIVVKDFQFNGMDSIMFNGALTKVQASQNADRAYIYGASVGLSVEVTENVTFKSVLNYTYGRYINSQNETVVPLDHIPPIFGQTDLVYKSKKIEGDFFVRYQGAKLLADYSPSTEDNIIYATPNGMPSWFTLNFRMSYNFTNSLRLNVACENITDNHYRVFASGISSAGRNFVVSARYKF